MSSREPASDGYEAETLAAGHRTDLYVGPLAKPDRYELLGPPMRGGEGTTWRARYLGALDQPVQMAVKVLHRPDHAEPGWPSDVLLDAWRDRVELLRSSAIPNLVRLFDVESGLEPHLLGQRDTPPTVLLQMEWVEGRDLTDEVLHSPASRATLAERLDWVEDLAEALSGLHGLGTETVHRDVSPNNCIVTVGRRLVLIDLSTMQLPVDGADLLGRHTPSYSAPEVLSSPFARRAPEADRWSFGAIVHLCLTGEHPVRSAAARTEALEEALRGVGAPRAAAAAVLELLDDDPDARPADLRLWVRRFRQLLRPRSWSGRPRTRRTAARAVPTWMRRSAAAVQRMLTAAAVAVIAGGSVLIAGLLQLRPVPETSTDDVQRWLVGAVAALAGVLLLVLRGRRVPWWVVLIGLLIATAVASGSALLLQEAWRRSAVPLAVGAGVLCVGSLGPPFRRTRLSRGWRAALALGLAAAVVLAGGVLRDPLSAHAVPVSIEEVIDAVPENRPVFLEPRDLAVNAAGDVAVVERHGLDQDEVWVLPRGGAAGRRVVVTSGAAQSLARRTLDGRRGDQPASISAVAWTADGGLLLLTDRGLFLASTVMGDGTPRLLTAAIRSRVHGIDRILVLGGAVVVQGNDIDTTPSTRARTSCDSRWSVTPSAWRLAWDGRTAGAPQVVEDVVRGCAPRVLAVAAVAGRAEYLRLIESPDADGDGEPDGYRFTWGALDDVAPLDLGTTADDPTSDGSWDGARAVVAAGRLVVSTGPCLLGRTLDGGALPAPDEAVEDGADCSRPSGLRLLAVERTDSTDEARCRGAAREAVQVDPPPAAPLAVGHDGTAFLLDTLRSRCSSTLRRLPPGTASWSAAQDATPTTAFDPGRSAFMSADRPDVQGDGDLTTWITWIGHEGRTQLAVNEYSPRGTDVVDPEVRAFWGGEFSDASVVRQEPQGDTVLVVHALGGRSELFVDGITDLAAIDFQHALIARCGQILEADLNDGWFVTRPDGAEVRGTALAAAPVRVLAGAAGGLAASCGPLAATSREAVVRPIAVDSVSPPCPRCLQRIVLAERYRLREKAVAQVRSLDVPSGRVTTVPGGDLAPLGLVPTDVTLAADGRIAVSTASEDGYGPVLILDRGKRTVLDLGDRWISGVAWRGSDLVLTDGRSGDVLVSTVPR